MTLNNCTLDDRASCVSNCRALNGVYGKDGVCYTYWVLKRICLMIDIVYSEDRTSHVITYDSGCYANGEPAYYEQALPDKLYKFEYIPVEIRYKYDPYTVWSGSNYNLGRNMSGLTNISYALLLSGVFFSLITCYSYHQSQKDVDEEGKPLFRDWKAKEDFNKIYIN